MNNLKTKLLMSALSLALAAVLLVSGTFAWFTLSTNPEIKGLSATMVVNENLEMAFASLDEDDNLILPPASAAGDTGNGYTWGNLVDFSTGTLQTDYTDFLKDVVLRPMTIEIDEDGTFGGFKYPVYSGNGRVDGKYVTKTVEGGTTTQVWEDELEDLIVEDTYGMGLIYKEKVVNANTTPPTTEKVVYGMYLDFWLRTNKINEEDENEGIPLILTSGGDRSSNGEEGNGSKITLASVGENAEYETLFENLRFAVIDVTPSDMEGAEPYDAENRTMLVIIPSSVTYSTEKKEYSALLDSETSVISLKPNQAKLVRVFIYLDGAALTNPDAAAPLDEISVNLNLQFELKDTELTSMDDDSVS